jgi:hypothetical protein
MNDSRSTQRPVGVGIAVAALTLLLAGSPAFAATSRTKKKTARKAARHTLVQNHRAIAAVTAKGGEAPRGESDGGRSAELERYENRAFPGDVVTQDEQQAAYLSYESIAKLPGGKKTNWQLIGPTTGIVASSATYTGRSTINSGRVTALAVSPLCTATDCRIFLAAAGGGIWAADNALAPKPNWHPSSNGLTSNAIGTIAFDASDPTGKTLYVGTGEPNSSADSEAGVGVFRSTDLGKNWTLLAASTPMSYDRAIGAVAVDPTNSSHIYFGNALGIHGGASVGGGAALTPNTSATGVYESTDGGATFTLSFTVNGSPFDGDIFKIAFDPADPATVYVAALSGGIYRRSQRLDGDTAFHKILSAVPGDRSDFSLTRKNNQTRIYVALGAGAVGRIYRADNADQPAAALLASQTTSTPGGWQLLTSSSKTSPFYSSYNFCDGQCWYDMFISSPPGQPDTVWLGGSMFYNEIFTAHPPSNGRAVQRSTDAGVHFTDMTNDSQVPALGMHPDQHAIAFAPFNGDIAFVGSDGGVVRTSGLYTDISSQCDARGLNPTDLANCRAWLSVVPTQTFPINDSLATLQFQSVSVNPQNPLNDILGGTQDNGTWAYDGKGAGSWFESVGGDGGQSGIHATNGNIRFHTYFDAQVDVNFNGDDPLGWNWIADSFFIPPASSEARAFYIPIIADPKVGGTMFAGLERVWRTKDNGGDPTYLQTHCNEFFGDFTVLCGDWAPLGAVRLTSTTFGADKTGGYVVATTRTSSDSSTLWAATRRGRLFISKNADAADPATVTFTRIDTASQPRRFISGVAVDGSNANHAFVSFSGYNVTTPAQPGHVFEVTYDPTSGTPTWTDRSYNLADLPITGIARDNVTGDLYAASDFGVLILKAGSTTWAPAAGSLPPVAVYGLTLDSNARVLYAATHGRGVYKLDISK